jgi:predicted SnoaL-like aldol condensation-catalyzing enzyme
MEQLEVAHRFVELWYAPERETELRSLLADGYLHHAPKADLDAEQFIGQLAYLNASLSDIDYRVLHAVADGEIVAVYVTAEATHTRATSSARRPRGSVSRPLGHAFCA